MKSLTYWSLDHSADVLAATSYRSLGKCAPNHVPPNVYSTKHVILRNPIKQQMTIKL